MSLSIPAFKQFRGPLFPVRGLWNAKPREGDLYVNAEINWTVTTTGDQAAYQFNLSGNSPVALSQIVALSVDNSRCASDVKFMFPDTDYVMTVPAFNQVITPVFTNALMFYAIAPSPAISGDTTIVQIMNSVPPPLTLAPSIVNNATAQSSQTLANGFFNLVPPPPSGVTVSGQIEGLSITIAAVQGASPGKVDLQLFDMGTAASGVDLLWTAQAAIPASTSNTFTWNLTGLSIRFYNGVRMNMANCTMSGTINVNVYYTIPYAYPAPF
jgi:hypothetical protein